MKNWKTYKLAELCEDISYGYTESATQENIGPKFLRITDIQNYFINWSDVPYCPITKENHARYKLEIGDIVIARTGATTGVTSIFRDRNIDAVYASYLIRYKINKKVADPFYIGHVLKSPLWQSHVGSIIGGSAQPGANAKQFGSFEFQLPELKTQSQIASILSSLDNKIELNLQMNQTLEAMAQAIFKEWFVEFRFPGSSRKPANGLPKGWRMGTVSEIYKTTSGGTPSRAKDDYYQNGTIKWVKSKELNGGFIFDTEEKITEEAVKNSSAKKLPRHSVLIAMYGATVGEYGVLSSEATCNQAICSIIPNDDYPYSYIMEYIKINKDKIIDQASGSAQQNISQALIQRQEILIPPSEIVKSFHQIVGNLFEKIEGNLFANQVLSQVRDSLLPKLMTGKIQVKA